MSGIDLINDAMRQETEELKEMDLPDGIEKNEKGLIVVPIAKKSIRELSTNAEY